jgi:Bacterial PH domain/zinc-ribbon domain
MSSNFCSRCGASIQADANFCHACGTPVRKSEAPLSQSESLEVHSPSPRNQSQLVTGWVGKNLMPGEMIAYETQLHWAIFIGPLVLFIVAVCLFSVGGNAPIIAVLLLLFGAIPTAIDAAVTRATSEFVVTNKRVLIKTGWIRRHSLETLLSKVEGIRVEQDILGRMFDYGTIVVTGTGGSKEQFHKISDPMLFRRRIQDEIAAGEGAPTYRKRLVD